MKTKISPHTHPNAGFVKAPTPALAPKANVTIGLSSPLAMRTAKVGAAKSKKC